MIGTLSKTEMKADEELLVGRFPLKRLPFSLHQSIFDSILLNDRLKLLQVNSITRLHVLYKGPFPPKVQSMHYDVKVDCRGDEVLINDIIVAVHLPEYLGRVFFAFDSMFPFASITLPIHNIRIFCRNARPRFLDITVKPNTSGKIVEKCFDVFLPESYYVHRLALNVETDLREFKVILPRPDWVINESFSFRLNSLMPSSDDKRFLSEMLKRNLLLSPSFSFTSPSFSFLEVTNGTNLRTGTNNVSDWNRFEASTREFLSADLRENTQFFVVLPRFEDNEEDRVKQFDELKERLESDFNPERVNEWSEELRFNSYRIGVHPSDNPRDHLYFIDNSTSKDSSIHFRFTLLEYEVVLSIKPLITTRNE